MGKREDGKTRLLNIVVDEFKDKRMLLTKSVKLRESDSETWRNVCVPQTKHSNRDKTIWGSEMNCVKGQRKLVRKHGDKVWKTSVHTEARRKPRLKINNKSVSSPFVRGSPLNERIGLI